VLILLYLDHTEEVCIPQYRTEKVTTEAYHFLKKECTEEVHPKGDGEAINFVSYMKELMLIMIFY